MLETKPYRFTRPIGVDIQDGLLVVTLADERRIATPLHWYPWLEAAAADQQRNIEFLPDALYWPQLDEALEVEGMLRGIRPANTHREMA